jgi:hypothetical protein
VTDILGKKIEDPAALRLIDRRLRESIFALDQAGAQKAA